MRAGVPMIAPLAVSSTSVSTRFARPKSVMCGCSLFATQIPEAKTNAIETRARLEGSGTLASVEEG
jgi:hypothetical protein